MNSRNSNSGRSPLMALTVKELEVLWLYDCKLTDTAISKLLFIDESEVQNIKSKLYKTFSAEDTSSLIATATKDGFVSKI